MANTYGDFAHALLRAIGAPINASTLGFMLAWMNKESGQGDFNPLGVNYQGHGQWDASSFGAGVAATASYLLHGSYEGPLLRALQSGKVSLNSAGVGDVLYHWSGNGYRTFSNDINTDKVAAARLGTASPGGGGGAGASGAGGTSPAELSGILTGLGLDPHLFRDFITQAVQQGWTADEVAAQLYRSPEFKNAFPGIFNPDGSLKMSASDWTQQVYGEGGIMDTARQYGIKVSRAHAGLLIGNDVSPTEWAHRALIYERATSSEVYRQSFNSVLKAAGQPALDQKGWWDLIAGKSDTRIENIYEASALRAGGLEISPRAALRASRQIGAPGEEIDVQKLVEQVQQTKDFIAPELRAAGISDADLAVLTSGADPKGIASALQQILKNRQALVGNRLVGAGAPSSGGLYPAKVEGL